jgi:Flp pilus assembly protein TadD
MVQAGNCARRAGDFAGAGSYFDQAAALRADSWIPPYNQAGLAAVQGDADGAFAALETSVARGLPRDILLAEDADLAELRADRRFGALLNRPAGAGKNERSRPAKTSR